MIRSLWIAKTGMDAQQTQLDVISNNLANVGTNGYKRQVAQFEDLLYQNLRQAGASSSQQTQLPTGLQLGTGVQLVATPRIFAQGNLQQTGNQFDMAVNGHGSFHIDSAGQLVNSSGFALTPAVTVPPTAQLVTIGADGTVSVTLPGQATPQNVGAIQLAGFINPAGLESKGQNLFSETSASGTPSANTPGTSGLGTLQQGYV